MGKKVLKIQHKGGVGFKLQNGSICHPTLQYVPGDYLAIEGPEDVLRPGDHIGGHTLYCGLSPCKRVETYYVY